MIAMWLWLALAGCGGVDQDSAVDVPPEMSAVDLLTRVSLDLRGVRPSLDELEAVEADPAAVEGYIDSFLQDERLTERIVSMWSEIYLTRQDEFELEAEDYGWDETDEPAFVLGVGEEPMRILARVVTEDLPYTELVTGDWTVLNEVVGLAWPTDYPEGETGNRVVHYTDGRPAAGVLATNSMWWRYMSNGTNYNRGRANAISKLFLCTDYLEKSIEFDRDVNLLDEGAVNEALKTNPGCYACHASLDPFASFLFGFHYYDYDGLMDISYYHPEREFLWQEATDLQPAYYGEPGYSLSDLGHLIAADPRFAECAVEQVWKSFLQRDVLLEDLERISALRETFLGADLKVRPLIRAVLNTPEYRAGETDNAVYVPLKMVSAEQLGSQIEAVTGYRMTSEGYDMLLNDDVGLRTLAGGVDGNFVTAPARAPMATLVLVQERLAQAAADFVVEQDLQSETPTLFTEIGFSETIASNPDAMVAQIQALHLRLFGARIATDGAEVEANLALWTELYDVSLSQAAAWKGVLTVLLRDPTFLMY